MENDSYFTIPAEWKIQGLPYHDESASLVKKTRTQEEIFYDVVNTLNSNLTPKAKYDVLNQAFSDWTEICGKHEGCKFWSKKAIECYKEEKKKNPKFRAKNKGKIFIHEHIVPKIVIMKMLLDNQQPDQLLVYEILYNLLNGAVIHCDEDKELNKRGYRQTMPEEFYDESRHHEGRPTPWWRYMKIGIDIVICPWDGEGNLDNEEEPILWNLHFDIPQEDVNLIVDTEREYRELLERERIREQQT